MSSPDIPSADSKDDPLRQLPSVDVLLRSFPALVSRWGHRQVSEACRERLAELRRAIRAGEAPDLSTGAIGLTVQSALEAAAAPSLKPVINLTGTVLHTNLGRASLPQEALTAINAVAVSPSNLEFDLDTGKRGDREQHVEALLCELTGAEAATVVNNNAAAVLLVLNTLALGRTVPVSRGELVEIGGSFRIPEVMQRAGCQLREVGATNRTHLRDYQQAIDKETALLMKVHASNYRVEGFTAEVAGSALADLAHSKGLPLVTDLGSGSLVDFADYGLPREPTVSESLGEGADLVTFSGDKLLGGPQAGIIAGRRELVEQVKSNPLKRALRLDKMTLAALGEVLKLYRDPTSLAQRLPSLRLLTRSAADIEAQCERLLPALAEAIGNGCELELQACHSQIGSGALPVATLPSYCLQLRPRRGGDAALRKLSASLRALPVPIIGRLHDGALMLDLRCLEDENTFLSQLSRLGTNTG